MTAPGPIPTTMTDDTRPTVGRVLFVTHNVPRFAGDVAGSFVLRLAVALRGQGVAVDIIAPSAPSMSERDTVEGIAIERVTYAAPERMTLAYSGTMAEAVRASWGARFALLGLLMHVRRRIRRRVQEAVRAGAPYDLVHAHWWFPSGVSAWSAGVGGSLSLPLVITMHGSDVRLAQGTPLSHAVMTRVLMRARVRTAVSRWLANVAERIVPAGHVDVAPMPVDAAAFVAPTDGRVRHDILFVGRLNAQKGLADLLSAFALVNNAAALLQVVGAGSDEAVLRQKAQSLGVADRVRWHGALAQSQLVPLYQSACVVAMPSREEGLGLVAVEAQLCETPVVAYASGGLTDVVSPQHGGSLVAPGDIRALASALDVYVADTHDARERVAVNGRAARAQMLSTFSPQAVARNYIALYQRALRAT